MGRSSPVRHPVHGLLMSLLTALFALRVLGQALQRWLPQDWLPPFGAFQGSRMRYPILLGAQILILGVMIRVAWQALRGTGLLVPARGRLLLRLGSIYFLVSLARIATGIGVESAPDWFSTWIPASFHLVLATFVMVSGDHERRGHGLAEDPSL